MPKASHKLNVFMNGEQLAQLTRKKSGAIEFTYDEHWVRTYPNFPISRQIPVSEETYKGDVIINYFENLLPDALDVREKIAAKSGAKSKSTYDLLSAIGVDCVGALQLVPEGVEAPCVTESSGTPQTEAEIARTLRNLFNEPLGIKPDDDFRISIAGNQKKTAFLKKHGKWLRPYGTTPTTHIFKPAMGLFKNGLDMSLSVENEWLCLEICRAFNFEVNLAEMLTFEDQKVLVVERFDRTWDGETIYRLPQEDLCQALGYPSSKKYQNEGGPGIVNIMKLLNESDKNKKDRKTFFKSQIVFWLLAGIDAHAKNYSVFWRPGGFQLTPIYDVLSASPLLATKNLNPHKIKMAMCVGKNRHYLLEGIVGRHYKQMSAQAKFPENEIEEILNEVLTQGPKAIEKVQSSLPADFPEELANNIFEGIKKRLKLI
ncbi:type II toxin-antitoxin system HipA family toxin [Bdellovibrionales bacterium]|nr:type II toxin-antitoxin system HipA family toxin [Bdellovibrionales bacterium]